MKGVSHARLIRTDTAHLNRVLGIRRTTFSERRSDEGDDMISAGKDVVANQPWVSVDDEVSAKFTGFFASLHELGRRQLLRKITLYWLC